MKKLNACLIAFCLLIGLAAGAVSEMNMQEGNWEMTIQSNLPGVKFKIPPMKYTVCVSKKNMNPEQSEKNKNCRTISSKIQGSTYSWVSECTTKEDIIRSEGRITYNGASMSGEIKSTGKKMKMAQTISGRRIGACNK